MDDRIKYTAITFDDVLLEPRYSEVVPSDVDVSTRLTDRIRLNIPMLSSPMDTVTEHAMAIALAKMGGIGIIHKNMSMQKQAAEVSRVKRAMMGIITEPFTLTSTQSCHAARELMIKRGISGLPVIDDGRVVGILTERDLRFEPRPPVVDAAYVDRRGGIAGQ